MSAPTDLELMMYYDGELDAERRTELEAWLLEADGDASANAGPAALGRGKLAGLEQVSVLMREHARVGAAEIDLVDAIMGRVAELDGAAAAARPDERTAASNGVSETKADASRAPKRADLPASVPSSASASANDNGRLIFVIAAVAAVAAAAMFYWGGRPADAPIAAGTTRAPTVAETARVEAPATAGLDPLGVASADTSDGEGEESPSVEVASVDFGKRSGAIYYVAGASQGSTTPVVWLTDE